MCAHISDLGICNTRLSINQSVVLFCKNTVYDYFLQTFWMYCMVKGSAQPKVLLVSDIHPCAQASNFEAPRTLPDGGEMPGVSTVYQSHVLFCSGIPPYPKRFISLRSHCAIGAFKKIDQ